jgi:hypothetical protein
MGHHIRKRTLLTRRLPPILTYSTSELPSPPRHSDHHQFFTMPQQQRHKQRSKEADIQLAELAIEQGRIQFISEAAETYNVSKCTLCDCVNRIASRDNCAPNLKVLLNLEEQVIIYHALEADAHRFQLNLDMFRRPESSAVEILIDRQLLNCDQVYEAIRVEGSATDGATAIESMQDVPRLIDPLEPAYDDNCGERSPSNS